VGRARPDRGEVLNYTSRVRHSPVAKFFTSSLSRYRTNPLTMVALASLRLVAPQASLFLHSKQLQHRLILPTLRHASTIPPPKPRVLEKPERFNPPSHPARIRSKPKYYGPDLSEHERKAQKTRRYPHMMPPEGTFMFWFLTNRNLHLYITLVMMFRDPTAERHVTNVTQSILVSLTVGIWYQDFMSNTPYTDLLPPNSMLFAHPITFFRRWAEVWQMHVAYVSAQTAERRKQKVDDVQKRSEYRKAHGQEGQDGSSGGLFGGWTAKDDADTMVPALREGGAVSAGGLASPVGLAHAPHEIKESAKQVETAAAHNGMNVVGAAKDGTYVDFEGNQQPPQKKWFGIW